MNSNYLFELGTEELPPKALLSLSKALEDSVVSQLAEAGLEYSKFESYCSPRRLAFTVTELADQTPLKTNKVWGPPAKVAYKDGEPTKAALGFCQRNGVDISAASIENDGKAEKLCVSVESGGDASATLLPSIIETALAALPIPKRMRWGAKRTEFVRPVQWLVLMQNDQVIPTSILGLQSGQQSRGHRFLSEGRFHIDHADQYAALLTEHKVMANAIERANTIRAQVEACAKTLGGTAVIDDDLLEEVTALVEWPHALAGNFEERFLHVPQEALISSMKEHQKYFHVVDSKGALMPHFITVSNLDVADTSAIVAGNEKVIRPRLEDAAFFFETDKKQSLESRREKLKSVVFQAKLGSIFDKTERIRALATAIAEQVGANTQSVSRTAELCKSDLVSAMVYEFPEMQGIAGSHYALNDGESSEVATAIAEHYQPKFAGDALPSSLTGAIVGLADRLDTLVGIFAIGQTPTGSKDPFALRRASVSILRLIVENKLDLDLRELLDIALSLHGKLPEDQAVETSLAYVLDRFKAMFEDAGISTPVFQAVAAKKLSQPLDFEQRVLAVAEFGTSENAAALAAANKRVANILAKLEQAPTGEIDSSLLVEKAEQDLALAISSAREQVEPLTQAKQYGEALTALSALRAPVDRFFEDVMVMADDEKLKQNRLRLLAQLRALFFQIADISLLDTSK